jgi:hypothetical protein
MNTLLVQLGSIVEVIFPIVDRGLKPGDRGIVTKMYPEEVEILFFPIVRYLRLWVSKDHLFVYERECEKPLNTCEALDLVVYNGGTYEIEVSGDMYRLSSLLNQAIWFDFFGKESDGVIVTKLKNPEPLTLK